MILQVARVVFIILEVLVLFNLLIVVHELGHFLAARWRGLFIEQFGVWFGKPIWKKKINGVLYTLGTIPAGGFVKLPQLAPMDIIEGKADLDRAELPKISALDKIIVAFAGPLFSFLLAIVFAVIVSVVGRPVSESESSTVIGYVIPNEPAAKAGLQAGDKILTVDGRKVTRFGGMGEDSISWLIVRSEGESIPITVERKTGDRTETLTFEPKPVVPPTKAWMRKALRQIDILPAETPLVARVVPDSPAQRAGLQPNDLLLAINDQRVLNLLQLRDVVDNHPGETLKLTVERAGQKTDLSFDPGAPRINGVLPKSPAERAGLLKGDALVTMDGQKVMSALVVSSYIKEHAGQPITLTVERDGRRLPISVTPEIPEDETSTPPVARIGIEWDSDYGIAFDAFGKMHVVHPSPVEQIRAGTMSIVNTIGAIASRKSDVKLQHVNGPVMMLRIYYLMFESREGWRMALWFSVVLNVNLALINLLPIPVLDGGHIVLALVESVRRRPVNIKVLEAIQSACAILIIGFMIYIAFFDFQDLFGRRDTVKFPGKSATPAKAVEK